MSVQADQTQGQKKRNVFPRWLRLIITIVALISLVVAAVIWIWHVWGDLSNTLSAIFGVLGAIFGFLALPFLYPSHESQTPTSNSLPSPIQVVNYFNSTPSQPTPSTSITEDNNEAHKPHKQGMPLESELLKQQLPPTTVQATRHEHGEITDRADHSQNFGSAKVVTNGNIKAHKQTHILDATLYHEVVQILEGLPATSSFQGRNALLIGLPRNIISGLHRDSNNDANDLENILSQLDGLGPLETGEQPLIIFIQNASRRAEGLAASRSLNEVLEELKHRYELL